MIHAGTVKKYFLLLASLNIFAVALLYGVSPSWFASFFFGLSPIDRNLAHIFRAMMCLYFGFGLYWLLAAFSPCYRNAALLTVMIFPVGLAFGRIISFFADGKPAPLLLLYMFAEFIQAPLAYWVFRLRD
ncbi:MAG TPA: DUF4345 domain-containing protein [Methylocella sp.]|nr:DUF4345 domain-containing protein [Methylocella sp.]